MAYPDYPDLERIAFPVDDEDEHPSGGHCASLLGESRVETWQSILNQHRQALDVLVEAATRDSDAWALTRPVLFAAHHVCELAMKVAFVRHAGLAQEPPRTHDLLQIWKTLRRKNAVEHLPQVEVTNSEAFLNQMNSLTPDGITARYPLSDPSDVGSRWCCLNSTNLNMAVTAFTARLEHRGT